MRRLTPTVLALALALGAVGWGAREAWAQEAPADSSLHQFLKSLSDSTDAYFGLTSAPLDTAGLDSALTFELANPSPSLHARRRFSRQPSLVFNRADGALWGASVALGDRRALWRVDADLGYTSASHRWLGGGEISLGMQRRGVLWRLGVRGGRHTARMDREEEETWLATIRAAGFGSDRQNYLRQDGVGVRLTGAATAWRAEFQYRDMLESPLAVTTRWSLAHDPLAAPDNLTAALGRAREVSLVTRARWPGFPLWSEAAFAVADNAIGSDFDYRRARVALAGEVPVAGHVSFVPQLALGRLAGDPVPQASFYLGGPRTLRSLPVATVGGTRLAIARLDVIGADDLLALLHLPHPAMFPIQGGLFIGTAAVWGPDPYGGPGTPSTGWPARNLWRSEAGASLLYRPGLGNDGAYLRLDYPRPLGSAAGESRWSLSWSRALNLLRPF